MVLLSLDSFLAPNDLKGLAAVSEIQSEFMRYRFSRFGLAQNVFGWLVLHQEVLDAPRIQTLRSAFLRQDSQFDLVNEK